MERLGYSPGYIDNESGPRTTLALKAFQQSRLLTPTGEADSATLKALGLGEGKPSLFTTYVITAEDEKSIVSPPKTVLEKSHLPLLGFFSLEELLAEKFHLTRALLHQLNPDLSLVAGATLRVPALPVPPSLHKKSPGPFAAVIRISLGDHTIEALDAKRSILAHFPCSIAADKNKRPQGELKVANYAPNPNYTFDPALFPDVAARENITTKLILPPGPNNPVGVAWIGLSLPTYGIHGTPDPENIGKTASHGCFRMTNWNVSQLYRMIRIGTPVEVVP